MISRIDNMKEKKDDAKRLCGIDENESVKG